MVSCSVCGQRNPDGFRFCGSCGSPLEDQGAVGREVRKTITVVFCDLAGSTALGERLDPESLQRVLGRYYQRMREVLERHEGTVAKFIGDAVVGVFGIPRLHEDDALRAARAAVELRTALAELNEELERDWGVRLQIRVGVNTGEVVAGSPAVGSALVLGDAVNVAARLEQGRGPGRSAARPHDVAAGPGRGPGRAGHAAGGQGQSRPSGGVAASGGDIGPAQPQPAA